MRNLRLALTLAVGLTLSLSACRKPVESDLSKPPERTATSEVTLVYRVAEDLNPNEYGEATPLDVRIYRLKNYVEFIRVSFEDLWEQDVGALGEAVVGEKIPVLMTPGQENGEEIRLKIDGLVEARYIGIMGEFQSQEERTQGRERRKICVEVDEVEKLNFLFTGHRIETSGEGQLVGEEEQDG